MLNQMILVGRLTHDIAIEKKKEKDISQENKKYAVISLAIPRSFKNMDGIYDTDFVDCILWDNVAINTSEYCHKGDIVGIKGRVQSRALEEAGVKKNILEVVAEKVTFLTSKNNSTESEIPQN